MEAAADVCIVVPVLRRPQNVRPLIETVAAATTVPYRLLFVATETDDEEIAELEAADADYITIDEPGTWARKCNLGARRSDPVPWILLAADDLRFHPMWFERAVDVARISGAKVIGTNDLGNKRTIHGEHSTHTLVHRSYIEDPGGVLDEGPGSLLHQGYPHEFADDELVETAKFHVMYAHSYQSKIEHLHYLWGKGEDDDVYRLGRRNTQWARTLFIRRRRMWRVR